MTRFALRSLIMVVLLMSLFLFTSCGKVHTVERGKGGEFVLNADVAKGLELNGPTPLVIVCPETELLSCAAPQGASTSSPATLGFTVSDKAQVGRVKIPLDLKFTYCRKKDDVCIIKDEKVKVSLDVVEPSGAGALSRVVIDYRIK